MDVKTYSRNGATSLVINIHKYDYLKLSDKQFLYFIIKKYFNIYNEDF